MFKYGLLLVAVASFTLAEPSGIAAPLAAPVAFAAPLAGPLAVAAPVPIASTGFSTVSNHIQHYSSPLIAPAPLVLAAPVTRYAALPSPLAWSAPLAAAPFAAPGLLSAPLLGNRFAAPLAGAPLATAPGPLAAPIGAPLGAPVGGPLSAPLPFAGGLSAHLVSPLTYAAHPFALNSVLNPYAAGLAARYAAAPGGVLL